MFVLRALCSLLLLPTVMFSHRANAQIELTDILPAFEVEFGTREGIVTCLLIRDDAGEGELKNCTFEDETLLTPAQMDELGLLEVAPE